MKTKALCASLVLFCLTTSGLAQTQTLPPPPPTPTRSQDKDDVVKITTNLVQVDAVVTKDGKQVTNLKAEDFQIFEDGKKQPITSFAYISNVPTITSRKEDPNAAGRDKSVPSNPLKREEPRRTLAIVVDDLGLSAESMSYVRRQLRKFVNEQLQPYDLVAIVRTGADVGALQQFTNDKRLLSHTVDQLRWNARSRVGVNVLQPNYGRLNMPGDFSDRGQFSDVHSTYQIIRFILDSMADIPGRKSMMVLSDSMRMEEDQNYPFLHVAPGIAYDSAIRNTALRRIAEMAIRNSVVIYSIDTQGLQPTGVTAADRFEGNVRDVARQMNDLTVLRGQMLYDRRAGGDMISRQTGGFQIRNSNDLKLEKVLEDQTGYYLIGYRPTDETFNRRFHKITAKVKGSGLSLRTRYGFFGYSEDEDVVKPPQSRMTRALTSPFGAQDLEINFTSVFANDKAAGSFIRSFVFLNAKDLTFETVDDKHQAKIEVQGIIFGDNGKPVEQVRNAGVVSLSDKEYEQALSNGIRVRVDMPARRPGAYQVRAAVRDVASSRIGAAGEFVFVPDLTKKQLAVSGILLHSLDASKTSAAETTVGTGARHFVPNSELYASCVIYNASIDAASQRPSLTIENRLFRDGKLVFTYPALQVDTASQQDLTRILVNLKFGLSADLEAGHYYLQFAITDKLLNKPLPVVQWANFEIVK